MSEFLMNQLCGFGHTPSHALRNPRLCRWHEGVRNGCFQVNPSFPVCPSVPSALTSAPNGAQTDLTLLTSYQEAYLIWSISADCIVSTGCCLTLAFGLM